MKWFLILFVLMMPLAHANSNEWDSMFTIGGSKSADEKQVLEKEKKWADLEKQVEKFMSGVQSDSERQFVQEEMKKYIKGKKGTTIEEELKSCQTQLQIIQDNDPAVYNKAAREFKEIEQKILNNATGVKAQTK